jgi:YidC/Oxa1 family membrane protein insertase
MKAAATGGKSDFAQTMNQQMLYLGPLLTLFIGARFPAGLPLYWLVMTLFMIGQQYMVQKKATALAPKN